MLGCLAELGPAPPSFLDLGGPGSGSALSGESPSSLDSLFMYSLPSEMPAVHQMSWRDLSKVE